MIVTVAEAIMSAVNSNAVLLFLARFGSENIDQTTEFPYAQLKLTQGERRHYTEGGYDQKYQAQWLVYGKTGASDLKTLCQQLTLLMERDEGFAISDENFVYCLMVGPGEARNDPVRSEQKDVTVLSSTFELMTCGPK